MPDWETGGIVAADPGDPYVVYGAFGNTLFRSGDGGMTWSWLRSFKDVRTLLVHPASPSTIYVGGADEDYFYGLFRSTNAGESWTRTALPD